MQDTIRFWPLAVTMLGMSVRDPVVVSRVVRLVRAPRFLLGTQSSNLLFGRGRRACHMLLIWVPTQLCHRV